MSSVQYDSGSAEMKTPILTSIYNVFGVLWIIGGALLALSAMQEPRSLPIAIASGAVALFMGLVCFGIAQVVMLIAKIEFNTRATDSSYQMVKLLTEISRNTASARTPA